MDSETREEIESEIEWQPAVLKPFEDWCPLHKNLAVLADLDLEMYKNQKGIKFRISPSNTFIRSGITKIAAGQCLPLSVHPEESLKMFQQSNAGLFECQVSTD
jgi:hypothetical protein